MSDEELMERVRSGDLQALGMLFERHKGPLFNFLLRFVHEHATAEDILIDAFLRVYDRRGTYKRGFRFSTWLYTIAHNLAVDCLKHASRREVPHDDVVERAVCDDSTPLADQFERAELADTVQRAVDRLPQDQRVVIILREYEGLSYREIADIVGATEEAVRVRAHRARLVLRQVLQPYVEGGDNLSVTIPLRSS